MVQDTSRKKRKLPKNATKKDDRYLMECIFGKRIVKKLDKIALKGRKKNPEISTDFFT